MVGREAGCQHVALHIVDPAKSYLFLSHVHYAKERVERVVCLVSSIGCAAKNSSFFIISCG